jgi:uncharacterized RDD family membrane protein YckC
VAPPGWIPPPEFAPPPAPASPTIHSEAADMAVRWRIRAARVDNLIVYGGYLLVCLLMHWRVAGVSHLFWLAVAGIVYHFVLEARDGQTIGKRRYGIRVVAADGGPASARAIAIRSVVRIFDSLPVCYVSGLISMVRTGPARRQRIGDIAAGTTVVAVDGRAAREGTPRWLLPVATIAAVLVSALTVVGITEAGHQPLNSVQTAEFISSCQNSPGGGVIDCQCLLGRLEADGYNTLDSLKKLESDGEAEAASGTVGPASVAVRNAALACRR